MAKWSERIIDRIATATAAKAGISSSPMGQVAPGGISTYAAPAAQLVGLAGPTAGSLATLLARDPAAFGGTLGPAFPIGVLPLDPVNPQTGRADPRKWQYEVAWNLDLQGRLAQWNILASAAVQIDIFSRAISIRTGDVTKMTGTWQISPDAINQIMEDDNCSSSEAARIARQQNINLLNDLNEFWENPYPMQDRTWEEWITECMWQILVYDGLAIHPRYNLGGKLIGYEPIEASTIKILLDDEGGSPAPPNAAYQQILYGFPRGEFVASPDKDAPLFMGGEYKVTDRDQLSYFVMNRRTNSPYGLSPVEQALQIGNVYVERLKWLLAEFTYGSNARGYMESNNSEMSQQNLADWNRVFNNYFSGQTSTRQLLTVLPDGFKAPQWSPQMDEKFKSEFDEMLIKRVSGFFGVLPSQFGVVPRAGLGGGKGASEGAQDESESLSSKPQTKYLERIVNSLARRYQGASRAVTFSLTDDEGSEDKLEAAKAHQTYFNFGALTANDIRKDLGMPEYEFPEADIPMIVTGTGATPLTGILQAQQTQQAQAQQLQENLNGRSLNSQDSGGHVRDGQGSQEALGQSQEGQDGKEGGGQSASSSGTSNQGGASKVGLSEDELLSFTTYVKRRTKSGGWRDFTFATADEDTSRHLNKTASDIVKGAPRPDNLFAYFLAEANGDIPKGKKFHNQPHVEAIAKKHKKDLESALAVGGLTTAIHLALNGAHDSEVADSLVINTGALQASIQAIYTEASQAAQDTSNSQTGLDISQAGPRLTALTDRLPHDFSGIDQTTTGHIMTAIQQGVENGDSADVIARSIQDVVGPMTGRQASMIAITEANRAYGASYLDSAESAGVEQINWETESDNPCPICTENESQNPYGIGSVPEFPAHPNCLCNLDSVIPN